MELCGTSQELIELAEVLLAGDGHLALTHTGDPAPFDRKLTYIRVTRTSGLATVHCSVDSSVLQIQGGGVQIGLLAQNIRAFATAGDVMGHLHVDYFPGHDYLAASSEPLVIALAEPGSIDSIHR